MQPVNNKEQTVSQFIHNFGLMAGKKVARYQAGRLRGEKVELVEPEVNRLGHKIRALRTGGGLSRRELAMQAGVDYTQLVLLEHGLLELAGLGNIDRRIIAALGAAEAEELENRQLFHPAWNAGHQKQPAYLVWGKRLLLIIDFLFLALVIWLYTRWAGGDLLNSPALWLAVAGGVMFLAGEKLAGYYWVLAGQWGDRAHILPPGTEKERAVQQRNEAEGRFRRSIGLGGIALLLVVGPVYLPYSNDKTAALLAALAGAVLLCGYRILALAYWQETARWRSKMDTLLQNNELQRTIRNKDNAYRLFLVCSLFMGVGAASIFLSAWSLLLAQVILASLLGVVLYLGVRYVLGRYYVDIDLLAPTMSGQ